MRKKTVTVQTIVGGGRTVSDTGLQTEMFLMNVNCTQKEFDSVPSLVPSLSAVHEKRWYK